MISSNRKIAQVQKTAAMVFHHEKVYGTPERNGILVYASVLERRVEIIVDGGLWGKVPLVEIQSLLWNRQSNKPHLLGTNADFLHTLKTLGDVCIEHQPRVDTRVNHIPQAVRVLS